MSNESALAGGLTASGRAAIPYVDVHGNPTRTLILNTYRSAGYRPDRPVVFVQHGVLRNGDEYRDFWIPAADRHGLLIVAPTFSDEQWPGLDSYNNGLVIGSDGVSVRPVSDWTYGVLGRIWADLQAAGITSRAQCHLFGHSAGGQFVHRLLSSQSHAPFEAAIAANAGWYTLPDLGLDYPEGMRIDGLNAAHLTRLLAFPLTLLLGECDNDVDAPNLPKNPEALRQGPHRHARGHHYALAGTAAAQRLSVPCNWITRDVAHIGHNGHAMSVVAASVWFEGVMPTPVVLAKLAGNQVA